MRILLINIITFDGFLDSDSDILKPRRLLTPFLAALQRSVDVRVLADGAAAGVSYRRFYLASTKYALARPDVLKIVVDELRKAGEWVKAQPKEAAERLAPLVGLDAPTLELANSRRSYAVTLVDEDALAEQQKISDAFTDAQLLPENWTCAPTMSGKAPARIRSRERPYCARVGTMREAAARRVRRLAHFSWICERRRRRDRRASPPGSLESDGRRSAEISRRALHADRRLRGGVALRPGGDVALVEEVLRPQRDAVSLVVGAKAQSRIDDRVGRLPILKDRMRIGQLRPILPGDVDIAETRDGAIPFRTVPAIDLDLLLSSRLRRFAEPARPSRSCSARFGVSRRFRVSPRLFCRRSSACADAALLGFGRRCASRRCGN